MLCPQCPGPELGGHRTILESGRNIKVTSRTYFGGDLRAVDTRHDPYDHWDGERQLEESVSHDKSSKVLTGSTIATDVETID